MKHKRPPIPVIIVVVLLLVGLGGWWWWSATRPAPATGLTLTGQVETNEIAVAPAMAGRITSVKASEGDQVKKGQVLVQLDTAALKLQVSQAKQGVTAAKAAVTNAQDDDDATKADVKAAKARLAQAEAAYGAMHGQVRIVRDLEPTTMARKMSALRSFFRYGHVFRHHRF